MKDRNRYSREAMAASRNRYWNKWIFGRQVDIAWRPDDKRPIPGPWIMTGPGHVNLWIGPLMIDIQRGDPDQRWWYRQ